MYHMATPPKRLTLFASVFCEHVDNAMSVLRLKRTSAAVLLLTFLIEAIHRANIPTVACLQNNGTHFISQMQLSEFRKVHTFPYVTQISTMHTKCMHLTLHPQHLPALYIVPCNHINQTSLSHTSSHMTCCTEQMIHHAYAPVQWTHALSTVPTPQHLNSQPAPTLPPK